jgi:hypothetical protein
MNREKITKIMNVVLPIVGIGLMIFYQVCDTTCSSLKGSFWGVDLKYIGILFMAVLLVLTLPTASRFAVPMSHLRTMMLAGALGGEVLLVRFQIVHETFCPFCLAFAVCLLLLFAAHVRRMNLYLAGASFLAGLGTFALFFQGSVLPLYSSLHLFI